MAEQKKRVQFDEEPQSASGQSHFNNFKQQQMSHHAPSQSQGSATSEGGMLAQYKHNLK